MPPSPQLWQCHMVRVLFVFFMLWILCARRTHQSIPRVRATPSSPLFAYFLPSQIVEGLEGRWGNRMEKEKEKYVERFSLIAPPAKLSECPNALHARPSTLPLICPLTACMPTRLHAACLLDMPACMCVLVLFSHVAHLPVCSHSQRLHASQRPHASHARGHTRLALLPPHSSISCLLSFSPT
jgi:hypothetical protein